ncbi:sn-glycerol 3-phosphate transport system substrate-binding protein [Sulfitobacter undariae]|uniref:sn-glycerol 3-phosphate transport system substrate-binding protein n=1 Tax=Sulfitobacter undariae TaxID=1563671 RepID=A0A7W6H1H4_9RHOB|nr:ABC transporter substrate-binding protein [Sulfitobacter undariae]MBB3994758.1 sn-glycerol 3-phosphate transport system substrate-binding protein [Sulfitobacter undariae]
MKFSKSSLTRRRLLASGMAAPFVSAIPGLLTPARASETTKIQFMYPVGASGDINTIISGMITEFNETHDGVEVEAIYSGSYDNTEQKVITSLGVGEPPSLWLPINSALQTFLGLDAIEDLTEQAKSDDIYDDFISGFIDTTVSEDRLYGLSFQASTPVLYYNKDAFAERGIENAPVTWDDLLETAKALTIRDGDALKRWGLIIGGGWHDWMFEAYCRQNGLVPWEKDKVLWDRPEAVEALNFWKTMVDAGCMPKASTWQGAANDFMAGTTAMLYHSTGSLTNLRKSSPFEVGVAFMPKKKTFGAAQGGGPIMIAKKQSDAKKEAAWTFARWMTNTQNQAAWGEATGYLAVRKSSWEQPEMQAYLKEVPQAKVALDQAAYSGAFLQVPAYSRARDVLKSAIDRTLEGEVAAEAALTDATAEVNREITRVLRRQKG